MGRAPGKTSEARERELISLAVDQAEKMLREGKAPVPVLTHYLKLGTTDYPLRKERIKRQNEMFQAKTEALRKMDHAEELAKNAIEAMMRYSGNYDADYEYEENV